MRNPVGKTVFFHRKVSTAFFKFWRIISPSLFEHYQTFDTRNFLENEMDSNFPWKEYVKRESTYFKKWGFKVSQLDAEYYSRVSGIRADHYVTRSMAVHFIYPYLDRYDFIPAYMDKNAQERLLGLPDDVLNVEMPRSVIFNSNGVFFYGNGEECTEQEAIKALVNYGKDTILKPTVDTYGGQGITKVSGITSEDDFQKLFMSYNRDFVFQEIVRQHHVMAAYNPTSVNTVRIVSYRDFKNERRILYACLRFGGDGSVMDNVCSGGGYTGIDITTGNLIDRRCYTYFVMNPPKMDDNLPNQIPYWKEMAEMALVLHGRLPQLNIVGWDFTVTPEGRIVLIEFNPRPGVGLQQAVGPMFNRGDLDEIMEHVSQVRAVYQPFGKITYKDLLGRRTVHMKFGS